MGKTMDWKKELEALLRLRQIAHDYYEKTGSKKELLISAEYNIVRFMERREDEAVGRGYELGYEHGYEEAYEKGYLIGQADMRHTLKYENIDKLSSKDYGALQRGEGVKGELPRVNEGF